MQSQLKQALPHTHTDGLRDASTIKLIHLKSLTVTSRRKPAAGCCCSLKRADSTALCRASRGPFCVTEPFLNYTWEHRTAAPLPHLCLHQSSSWRGVCKANWQKMDSVLPLPFFSFTHLTPVCFTSRDKYLLKSLILSQDSSCTSIWNLLFISYLPHAESVHDKVIFENKAWPCGQKAQIPPLIHSYHG